MRIVVDENIACLQQTFALHGELIARAGRALQADDVRTADALIVRSVTRVDAALLAGSPVKFVGSCTIGTDHIDLDYLAHAGISFAHAPGCNARAVAEYVIAALFNLLGDLAQWRSRRVGIVGFGNVGRSLAQLLDKLGVQWVAFDPLIEPVPNLVGFDEILRCDIISLHVPLSRHGDHTTYHWFDADLLRTLSPSTVLINAARGAVISNAGLLATLSAQKLSMTKAEILRVVLDVFENEPGIDRNLLDAVTLATPHIAGYSVQGKARGTWQVYRAFCKEFGVVGASEGVQDAVGLDCAGCATERDVVLRAYDIAADDAHLRSGISSDIADHFDALRKQYPSRQEWSNRRLTNIAASGLSHAAVSRLQALGFIL
jgi:erythronate-4-phosphate dehydrogenase